MRSLKKNCLIPLLLAAQFFAMNAWSHDGSFVVEELNEGSTYVVLCPLDASDPWLSVARRLGSARKARAIIRFDLSKPDAVRPILSELQPENVAYVIPPKLITPDLAGRLAELSSRIHPDKLVDYASGYVTGVTADDAMNLIDRTLAREATQTPVPRACIGIGQSWFAKEETGNRYFVMASREQRRGPTLRLTDENGDFEVLSATADVYLSQRTPDRNFQRPGLNQRLILSPGYGCSVLIDFDLPDESLAESGRRALLEIPVDDSRWKFAGKMVVGVSPIESPWKEGLATWNHAPDFDKVTTVRAPADAATTSLTVDITSLLDRMQHGLALFHHSSPQDIEHKTPLRHMYHHMKRIVADSQRHGFDGEAIETLAGDRWMAEKPKILKPISKGGMILFGGHGSASSSCLISSHDLAALEIGPSVVINGTCYGATTHTMVNYGLDADKHREVGRIDPTESFSLQLLRHGSLACIGGSAKCSFGHVDPAVALLRDQHKSLGQAIQHIQNQFIESVQVDTWEANGMQSGDPGFASIDRNSEDAHPTLIQYTIRTICLGDPAFVPFPE